MAIADFTVNFTISNLALVLIVGALAGLITGQLMKSRGINIIGDLAFGLIGAILADFFVGPLLGIGRYGFTAFVLLAIAGAVILDVLLHGLATARRKAAA